MNEEITQRVIRVIAHNQHVDPSTINPDSTFAELGIDSLDGLHILFALEEEFGLDIPDDVARTFTSIRQAVDGCAAVLEKKIIPA